MTSSVVVVTGASTGFGRGLAAALPGAGHRPIATMRDVDGRNADNAAALRQAGIDVVGLDVDDERSVEQAVAQILELAGRIDVVVNNAGYGIVGPLEAATVEDLKAQFETNVYGPHRVVRAVLPHMRERGSGLLVSVSSGAGRLPMPGSLVYCASKWALEAMAEGLRYELAPLGIDSVIVEPGPYATEFHARVHRVSDEERAGAYGHVAEAGRRRGADTRMADPREVVDAIIGLVDAETGSRPARVVCHPTLGEALGGLNRAQSETTRAMLELFRTPELGRNGT